MTNHEPNRSAGFRPNRRDAIASLLAISASGALAACAKTEAEGGVADTSLRYAKGARFFSDEELSRISVMAETIIPTTDTPGAVAAGVPEVMQKLASEWGDDEYRRYMRGGVARLHGLLSDLAGEDFSGLPPAARDAALSSYDAKVYDGSADDQFYRDFKSAVATAYYMSEPGATEELAYEAVPGEWIGQAPVSQFPKTWAT